MVTKTRDFALSAVAWLRNKRLQLKCFRIFFLFNLWERPSKVQLPFLSIDGMSFKQ